MGYHSIALDELKKIHSDLDTFSFTQKKFWVTERQKLHFITKTRKYLFFRSVKDDFLNGIGFPMIFYP